MALLTLITAIIVSAGNQQSVQTVTELYPEVGSRTLATVLMGYLFADGITSFIIALRMPPAVNGCWLSPDPYNSREQNRSFSGLISSLLLILIL
jgi:hypothetical protein